MQQKRSKLLELKKNSKKLFEEKKGRYYKITKLQTVSSFKIKTRTCDEGSGGN